MFGKTLAAPLALVMALALALPAPAAQGSAQMGGERAIPLPDPAKITEGGSWDEVDRTFSAGTLNEALAALSGVQAVELGDFESLSDFYAAGGGELGTTIWFSTKENRFAYTYSFYGGLLGVSAEGGYEQYYGMSTSLAAAKEKLRRLAQGTPPTLPDLGGVDLWLINDQEKTAAWCDGQASDALEDLCRGMDDFAAPKLQPRAKGVSAIELKSRYKTRYELCQNGMRAGWWSICQPVRELYPAMEVSFPKAKWDAFLTEADRQYARCEKAPLWLAMINPAKIAGARVYDETGRQLFSSSDPGSIEPRLSGIRVKPGSYEKTEDTATLRGSKKIEVDFTGGVRYRLLFNDAVLMLFSSDLGYGARYLRTEEGARKLGDILEGGFPYNPPTGG